MFRRALTALRHLDFSYFNRGLAGHIAFSKKFYGCLGIEPPASSGAPQGLRRTELGATLRRQLAASVQQACAVEVAELAEAYGGQTGASALCLSVGVFLNPLLVVAVEKNTGFARVHRQPAAGNEGTSFGSPGLAC